MALEGLVEATVRYADGRYPYTAAAAVHVGEVISRPDGSLAIYDALQDAASGDLISPVPILPCTVIEVVAATVDTWSAGASIYWDATNNVLTTTSSGNTLIGKVPFAKTAGQLSALVVIS